MGEMAFRSAQPMDMKQVKEIIKLSFEPAAEHPDVVDDMENETWFGADCWIVGETGGRVITAMGLRPGVMWMSGLAVPTSTVGTVCTRPEARGRGMGSQLLAYADSMMQARGDVLSRLHTWPARYALYGRAGYVKAVNERPATTFAVDKITSQTSQDAERRLGGATIRPARPEDAPRLLEVYEATWSKVTGCLSRDVHFMRRRIERKPKFWHWGTPRFDVVDDPAAGVVAYIACELGKERQHVTEIAALPGHTWPCRPLLVHVAHEAQAHKFTHVTTALDVHCPLYFVLRNFPITGPEDSTVLFLKVQDERRLVELIRPVIAGRARHHEVKLTMHVAGIGEIVVGDGRPLEIVTDVPHLAALFYNGVWLAGLIGQGALQVRPDTMSAHNAVRQLFPDTHAQRCEFDGY
jgi:predicted N-acetyltransferase YhbS